MRRLGICGNRRIARHAQRVIGEVGEQWRAAIVASLARMTGRTVALLRVIEELQAAPLGCGQFGLACKSGIIFRIEGLELRRLTLVTLECVPERREGGIDVIQAGPAKDTPEIAGVLCAPQLFDDSLACQVGHLVGRQQWPFSLRSQRIGTAIVIETAGGLARIVIAKVRRGSKVAQRRHGARTWLVKLRTAELYRTIIRRRMRMPGRMAAGARLFAGGRQQGIVENQLADSCGRHGRRRGHRCAGILLGAAACCQQGAQYGHDRSESGHRRRRSVCPGQW